MRRRRPPAPRPRSDFAAESGRLWAPDAAMNVAAPHDARRPSLILDDVTVDLAAARTYLVGPDAPLVDLHVPGDDPAVDPPRRVRLPAVFAPNGKSLFIDIDRRTVDEVNDLRRTRHGWEAESHEASSLDGDGAGYGAGLVLERELAARYVGHALAVACTLPAGTRLALVERPEHVPLGIAVLVDALAEFGAYAVPSVNPPRILVERSACSDGANTGPIYRAHGLTAPTVHVPGLRLAAYVPAPRRRWWQRRGPR